MAKYRALTDNTTIKEIGTYKDEKGNFSRTPKEHADILDDLVGLMMTQIHVSRTTVADQLWNRSDDPAVYEVFELEMEAFDKFLDFVDACDSLTNKLREVK